jgi:hypothetical protein
LDNSLEEKSSPALRRATLLALWLGVGCVVFCLAFFPLRASTDEWWHLKTGKWIVEHGYKLPRKDIFSYTSANYDWDNHEWLTQTGMYLVWRWGEERVIGGWRAVIAVKALLLAATYLLLGRFLWQRAGGGVRGALIGAFLALVAAAVGKRMFWPRPPIVSAFLTVAFLYAMWLHRTGRLKTPWLLLLPLVMSLWANLHGGFLIGGLIVAAYFGGELLEWAGARWILRKPAEELQPKLLRVGIYLGLGVLCGLGSLLNPFGYKLYLLTQRVMSNKELVSRLDELRPPNFHFVWAYIFLFTLVGAGFLALLIRTCARRSRRWPPLAEIALTLLFFKESILHVRHLLLFGLVAAPVAAWMLAEWWGKNGNGLKPALQTGENGLKPALQTGENGLEPALQTGEDGLKPALRTGRASGRFLNAGLAVVTVGLGFWLVFMPYEVYGAWSAWKKTGQIAWEPTAFGRCSQLWNGESEEPGTYPRQAVRFILSAKLPPRMYNRDTTCGYLIWALSPEHYQLFTDNRFDIFGGDFLADELSVANGYPDAFLKPYGTPVRDWRKVVEQYGINWLFIPKGELIHEKLLRGEEKGWVLIYQDWTYAIWMKDTPQNRPWIEKYGRRL